MGKEILSIPEEKVQQFIKVVEAGLSSGLELDASVVDGLRSWCEDHKERRIEGADSDDRMISRWAHRLAQLCAFYDGFGCRCGVTRATCGPHDCEVLKRAQSPTWAVGP